MNDRKKVNLLIPKTLVDLVDSVGKEYFGIGRNSIFVLGVATILIRYSSIIPSKNRAILLDELQQTVNAEFEKIRKTA